MEGKKKKKIPKVLFLSGLCIFSPPAISLFQSTLWNMLQMQEHFAPFFPWNRVETKLATAHTMPVKGSSVLSEELFTSCKVRNKLSSTTYFTNFTYCKSLALRCSGVNMKKQTSIFTLLCFTMAYKQFVYLL